MDEQCIIELHNITKEFPGVKALDSIDLKVRRGEIHAVCGANGAGKSTLMKIISGAQSATSGKMLFNGREVKLKSTKEATELGISMIYQEFNLIPYLSIAENIFIGRLPLNKYGLVDWKRLNEEARKHLNKVNLDIDPLVLISQLSVGEAQLVEIAKCLSLNSKVIIMDEPTAALTEKEIEYLFNNVKELRNSNISILYISHRLDEIFEIADRITVFRDGKYITTRDVSETSHDELVRLMIGKDIQGMYPEKPKTRDNNKVILAVDHFTLKGHVKDVSLLLREGEILGIAGLMGSGNIALGKALSGYYSRYSGEVTVKGKMVKIKDPITAIKNGIACVSDDRKQEGLVLIQSVRENITAASVSELIMSAFWPFINKTKEKDIVYRQIKRLNIKVSSSEQIAGLLSGGNQQKVVFAKNLEINPDILILNEPTRGIDIGAKAEIYQIMRELTTRGIGILLISSEIPELIGMSDRIIVMKEGRIVKEFKQNEMTQASVLHYAAGGNVNDSNEN